MLIHIKYSTMTFLKRLDTRKDTKNIYTYSYFNLGDTILFFHNSPCPSLVVFFSKINKMLLFGGINCIPSKKFFLIGHLTVQILNHLTFFFDIFIIKSALLFFIRVYATKPIRIKQ